MKRSKTPYHHGDLKRELMTTAISLIDERGLDRLTVRELAKRVGVTHAATYKHFVDKRALLVEIALHGFSSFTAKLNDSVDESASTAERIDGFALAYYTWASRNSAAYQIMFGPRLNEDNRHPELEEHIEVAFQAADAVFLDAGFSESEARDCSVALTTQLHGFVEMTRLRRIRVRNHKVAIEYLGRLIQPFASGVRFMADQQRG